MASMATSLDAFAIDRKVRLESQVPISIQPQMKTKSSLRTAATDAAFEPAYDHLKKYVLISDATSYLHVAVILYVTPGLTCARRTIQSSTGSPFARRSLQSDSSLTNGGPKCRASFVTTSSRKSDVRNVGNSGPPTTKEAQERIQELKSLPQYLSTHAINHLRRSRAFSPCENK